MARKAKKGRFKELAAAIRRSGGARDPEAVAAKTYKRLYGTWPGRRRKKKG